MITMENNKLEELTKKIQKQVPEIMELKFGCKLLVSNCCEDNEKRNIGQYKWISNEVTVGESMGKLVWFSEDSTDCMRNVLKVIGRNITLEDVLITIRELNIGFFLADIAGLIYKIEGVETRCLPIRQNAQWKFNKPLHEQDEDMINYLYNLIVKK